MAEKRQWKVDNYIHELQDICPDQIIPMEVVDMVLGGADDLRLIERVSVIRAVNQVNDEVLGVNG